MVQNTPEIITVETEEKLAGRDLESLSRDEMDVMVQPAPLYQGVSQHLQVIRLGDLHFVGHVHHHWMENEKFKK